MARKLFWRMLMVILNLNLSLYQTETEIACLGKLTSDIFQVINTTLIQEMRFGTTILASSYFQCIAVLINRNWKQNAHTGKWCYVWCCNWFKLNMNGKFTEYFCFPTSRHFSFVFHWYMCPSWYACWQWCCQSCNLYSGALYLWILEPNFCRGTLYPEVYCILTATDLFIFLYF